MNWKETLAAVAPTLATALGGPLAGAATKFISGKLLGKDDSTLEEIEQAVLGASPEQLANLKNIDYEFKKEMEKLKKELRKIETDLKAHRKTFKPGNKDKSYGNKIDNFRDIWSRKKSQIHQLDKDIDNYKQKLKT